MAFPGAKIGEGIDCFKQLFGDEVSSRILDTQTAEIHARIAAMNPFMHQHDWLI
ncbi:hypothetical protein CCP3SC5AM1_1250007 [Gammaproteobacteria bacterium]